MEEKQSQKRGNIILENREKLTLSGIIDVESYLPDEIVFITEDASLVVRGREMKVKKFSSESSDATVEGEIDAILYSTQRAEKKSVLKRIFR